MKLFFNSAKLRSIPFKTKSFAEIWKMSKQENKIKIMPRAVVCEDSNIKGDVTISSGCVVHPSAQIIAESGPIVIGENCIIEEYAKIVHRIPSDHKLYQENPEKPHVLVIGSNNIFEVGCTVEALKIGEKNIFECKSYVSPDVTISSGCVIGAGCHLSGEQVLSENSVIFGKNCHQREAMDKQGSHMLQLDFLRKILPNYHHLRKAVDIKSKANFNTSTPK